MQTYEIGYLILPSIPEERLVYTVETIKAAIVKEGGAVLDGEEPFKQALSYTMTKTIGASRYVVKEAYLGWLKFESEPEKAPDIKDALLNIEELLRFLLIKAPRETTFTFAKAREALEKKEESDEEAQSGPKDEAVVN